MANTQVTGDLIADGAITAAKLSNVTTDTISEGTALYYTDARVASYLSANSYATEGYVTTAVNNLIDAAPASLDTLNELAAALNDDANFATTVTNALATKLNLSGGTLAGNLIVNARIGVGISSPSAPFVVSESGAYGFEVDPYNQSNSVRLLAYDRSTSSRAPLRLDGSPIIVMANGSEALRVDPSGNVGINNAPVTNSKLTVNGNILSPWKNTGTHEIGIAQRNSNIFTNLKSTLILRGADAISGGQAMAGGDVILRGGLAVANEGIGVRAGDVTIAGGATTQGTSPGAGVVKFETAGAERMRITSAGFLKASNTGSYVNGATSTYHTFDSNLTQPTLYTNNTSGNGDGLLVRVKPNNSGNYFLRGYSSEISNDRVFIYSNGDIKNANNSYGVLSDIKLKENITDATPKLDDLMQVKIRNYNLIGEDLKQIGVIAQELEKVFPALVDEHPDTKQKEIIDEEGNPTTHQVNLGTTTKSVKTSVFVPILIKAIQELKDIVDQQQIEIDNLKAQLNG